MSSNIKEKINEYIEKNNLRDFKTRSHKFAYISMLYSFSASGLKIILAFYLSSYFLIASGIYSMTVGLTTSVFYRGVQRAFQDSHKERKYTIMIYIGLFFCSFIYSAYMIRLFFFEVSEFQYGVISSLMIALIAFTELGVAINGLIRSNQIKDSLLTARKTISFVGGLIALVMTQSAILAYVTNNGTGHQKYNAMLGLLIGVISMTISIVMFFRSKSKSESKISVSSIV